MYKNLRKETIHCQNCNVTQNEKKLSVCSGCQLAHYCSRECQKAHWKNGHKEVCKKNKDAISRADAEKIDIHSLKAWVKFHRPTLSTLVAFSLLLNDPTSNDRVLYITLESNPEVQQPNKKFKITETSTSTLEDFAPMAATLGLDVSKIPLPPSAKNKTVAFCFVKCPPVADLVPFVYEEEFKALNLDKKTAAEMAKNNIDVINSGYLTK
eukprot:Phypoly_transcript_18567.p1 GENE.Phypoly_transcript_18567~~Phypoly_transcript_18567.p1  ORF type:complete len:210 (-),score=34.14 Phypoly_transcript_18567:4-633(-)